MDNIKIISDGTTEGTRVKIGDTFINNITKIEIEPLEAGGGLVRAKLTIDVAELEMEIRKADITCNDFLMEDKIRQALFNYCDSLSNSQ